MARLVKVIGTGEKGRGMERGPRMQVTAVNKAIIVMERVFVLVMVLLLFDGFSSVVN
jgi:hypothetical protein